MAPELASATPKNQNQAHAASLLPTPDYLRTSFQDYVGYNVLIDGGVQMILLPYPTQETIEPHTAVVSGTCKNYSNIPTGDVQNQNYFEMMNKNRYVVKVCAWANIYNRNITSTRLLRGSQGVCRGESPYTAQCLSLNFEKGIEEDAKLAATAAKLQPDQYGQADKMVFNKAVINDRGQTFNQAIISFRKQPHSSTRQLKTLYINVSHVDGQRRISDKKVWWPA
jgi:hypothetical protein